MKKKDLKTKQTTVLSDAITNSRPDSNGRLSLQLPDLSPLARLIATPSFSGAQQGPQPSESILKNATGREFVKKLSTKIPDSPMRAKRKNSEDQTPTDLTEEKRGIF